MLPLNFIHNIGNIIHNNIKDPFPDIPGDLKLPFVGSTFEFSSDLNKFVEEYWKKYGDLFKVRVFGANVLMMVGPEANKLVLHDQQQYFLNKESWGLVIGELFKGAILLTDGDEHRRFRRIMQTAFHRKPMMGYLEVINSTVSEYLQQETISLNSRVKMYSFMEKLTLQIAGKLFFGVEFTEKQLKAITAVTRASADPLHLNIPFTRYGEGLRYRKVLSEFYKERIRANRKHPGEDLFSYMCIARSESGEQFTDEEIIDQMIFLMMASHDTTTSTLVSIIYETAKDSKWQKAMREECRDLDFGDFVSYEGLKELKLVEQVMNECLRLHPALGAFPRLSTRDFEFNGYKIPAYTYIGISPKLSHLRSDIFSNPLDFDPDRFSENRAEHKKHSHAFIPFGAGNHICLGKYFAIMEVKIVLYHFIRHFKWSTSKNYKTKFLPPLNHPRDGLPVKLERIGIGVKT